MSDTAALAQLAKRIARTHGWPTAKAFKSYVPGDRDKALIANKARELLAIFPAGSGGGGALSAAFAAHLERDLTAPVLVVRGHLKIMGTPLAGHAGPSAVSAGPDHDWVMVGPYIADISIFRLAYSREAPPHLLAHVYDMFGPDQAMLFASWRETRRLGFDYDPELVLSTEAVDALVGDAHRIIEAQAVPKTGD